MLQNLSSSCEEPCSVTINSGFANGSEDPDIQKHLQQKPAGNDIGTCSLSQTNCCNMVLLPGQHSWSTTQLQEHAEPQLDTVTDFPHQEDTLLEEAESREEESNGDKACLPVGQAEPVDSR